MTSIMNSICVYLGANTGYLANLPDIAAKLGQELTARGISLIYGGSSFGLMGILAQSVIKTGGEVIGIIPKCLLKKEKPLKTLTKMIITETMQERKLLMQKHADAFLVMPGGLGTLEEAIETWNAIKIGNIDKPIGFLNLDGYYDELLGFMAHSEEKGFMSSSQLKIPVVHSDVDTLLNALLESSFNKAQALIM